MKTEEKDLLLKDLCARLPYSIQVYYRIGTNELKGTLTAIYPLDNAICVQIKGYLTRGIECIKPYLRPMSSMTEEEKDFIRNKYFFEDWNDWTDLLHYHYHQLNIEEIPEFMDWIYAHHFDFPRKINGELTTLISLSLALEAPEGMYKNKEE